MGDPYKVARSHGPSFLLDSKFSFPLEESCSWFRCQKSNSPRYALKRVRKNQGKIPVEVKRGLVKMVKGAEESWSVRPAFGSL